MAGGLLTLTGCNLPGKPGPDSVVQRPTDILDPVVFTGRTAPDVTARKASRGQRRRSAIRFTSPLWTTMRCGTPSPKDRPGTAMSAFAESEGGMLTAKQVDAIIHGMRQRWGQSQTAARCHRSSLCGEGARAMHSRAQRRLRRSAHRATAPTARAARRSARSSIRNYLSLITDQGLRTIVITGRPDFNAPDWRNNVPGHPMSDEQITDVVAWLAAQRPAGAATASPAAPATSSATTTTSPGGQQ